MTDAERPMYRVIAHVIWVDDARVSFICGSFGQFETDEEYERWIDPVDNRDEYAIFHVNKEIIPFKVTTDDCLLVYTNLNADCYADVVFEHWEMGPKIDPNDGLG